MKSSISFLRRWMLVLGLPATLALVMIALVWDPVWDLSSSSLSFRERSGQILSERTLPVQITWYHSRPLDRGAFRSRPIWRDLRSLESRSALPVRVDRRDPGREALALAELGRLGARALEYQADTGVVSSLYSAILVEYGDTQRILPWVDSRETLSIELCRVLESLVRGRQDLVSLLAPPEDQEVLEALLSANGRAVRRISPGQAVPDTSDSLVVLGPIDAFSASAVQLVEEWILDGGSCFIGLDRVGVDLNAGSAVRDSLLLENPAMDGLLMHMGITLESFLVHDERSLSIASQKADGLGGSSTVLQGYPWWPAVPESVNMRNSKAPFAHPGADLFWASPLRLDERAGWKGGVLLASSRESRIPALPWYLHPAELRLNATGSALGPQKLAVYLEREDMEHSRIVVVGDSQFLGPLAARTDGQASRNDMFFLDCLDWLEGRDVLNGIRSSAYRHHAVEAALPLSTKGRLCLLLPLLVPLVFISTKCRSSFKTRRFLKEQP